MHILLARPRWDGASGQRGIEMKRVFLVIAATIALAFGASAASAGAYVAVTAGYGSVTAHQGGGAMPAQMGASGLVGGGEVGYITDDSLFGVHVGALASFGSAAGLSGKTRTLSCPAMYCGSDIYQDDDASGGFIGTARALVGAAFFHDHLFVAADAGAAYLQVSDTQTYTDNSGWGYTVDKNGLGYVLGARALYAFGHWATGIDYSYVSVGLGGSAAHGPGYRYEAADRLNGSVYSWVLAYNLN